MKNTSKQIVRHFNHKHSRLLEQLITEDKLKSDPSASAAAASATPPTTNVSSAANFTQSLENSANNCFTTNQVLVIIAVTCFLNFAFIVLIMMCVQILGSTANEREMLVYESYIDFISFSVITFERGRRLCESFIPACWFFCRK